MSSVAIIKKADSWDQFRQAVSLLPTTLERGNAFEILSLLFLQTDPRYQLKLKNVWLRKDVPQTVVKRLGLPATDEGIDGIAETRDGDFWAWQSKYRNNAKHALTKNELDGFTHLALTYCKGISKALVIHTSSAAIKKHKILQVEEIGLREFQSLDTLAWQQIHDVLDNRYQKPKPRDPATRPYQQKAIEQIVKHLKTNPRGRVLMPCGTGKSLVGFWVQQKMNAKQVVVAVPSLALLNQTLREWSREWIAHNQKPHFTVVCSDDATSNLGDTFVSHAYEMGIDTYTLPKDIAARLVKLKDQHHVVFTTYQSSHQLALAARKAKAVFDLGILDEAHKTVGEKSNRFATLLDEKQISIRKRLAMTATQRVLRGKNDDVLSMDDIAVYGEVAFLYTFKQAIADEAICDYKIVTLTVSESRIRKIINENKYIQLNRASKLDRLRMAQDLAAGELLVKAFDDFGVRHAISFHRNIDAAEGFADQWDVVGKMVKRKTKASSFHVSSKVATGRRFSLLKEFEAASASVITNARCLTEGVDVPNVDAILFADPRRSHVDIVQAVGRALRRDRKNPSKTGYVLLPVIVPNDQTIDEFLDSSAFKEIGRVLATLSVQDDRIAEEFRAVELGVRAQGESRIQIIGDVPVGMKLDAKEFAEQCRAKIWERVGQVNLRPFEEAREFVRGLRLKSRAQWRSFHRCEMPKIGIPPADIPACPDKTYRGKGWSTMGDWLGTGRIADQFKIYREFSKARKFVHGLKLKNQKEWNAFCKGENLELGFLPGDIPANPYQTYLGKGWITLGDWLGTGTIAAQWRKYRSFQEARSFARKLKLNGQSGWFKFCQGKMTHLGKLPEDIPAAAQRIYKDEGWLNWGDWLGTGTVATLERKYRSFEEAKKFAQALKLKSEVEWKLFCRGKLPAKGVRPLDIPMVPSKTYSHTGWTTMGDFLGTGTVANYLRKYLQFKFARGFVHDLKLRNQKEWQAFCQGKLKLDTQLPINIPANPYSVYANKGWVSWTDWLGTSKSKASIK